MDHPRAADGREHLGVVNARASFRSNSCIITTTTPSHGIEINGDMFVRLFFPSPVGHGTWAGTNNRIGSRLDASIISLQEMMVIDD